MLFRCCIPTLFTNQHSLKHDHTVVCMSRFLVGSRYCIPCWIGALGSNTLLIVIFNILVQYFCIFSIILLLYSTIIIIMLYYSYSYNMNLGPGSTWSVADKRVQHTMT